MATVITTPKAQPRTNHLSGILASQGVGRFRRFGPSVFRRAQPVRTALQQAARYSPHIDEILCQCHGVRIPGYGDRAVRRPALTLLAIADSNHGSGDLTDLGDLGTALADDATDQLIWHGHLVRLIVRRRLLSVRVARA